MVIRGLSCLTVILNIHIKDNNRVCYILVIAQKTLTTYWKAIEFPDDLCNLYVDRTINKCAVTVCCVFQYISG